MLILAFPGHLVKAADIQGSNFISQDGLFSQVTQRNDSEKLVMIMLITMIVMIMIMMT